MVTALVSLMMLTLLKLLCASYLAQVSKCVFVFIPLDLLQDYILKLFIYLQSL